MLGKYVLRRLGLIAPVLLAITVLVFTLGHLAPGDVTVAMFGGAEDVGRFDREEAARLRRELGLDRPLAVQYVAWLGQLVQGELGRSLASRQPVGELIAEHLPHTGALALGTMLLAVTIGLPLGMLSATRRGTPLDNLSRVTAILGISLPVFWEGLLLIIVFALWLGWFPVGGSMDQYGARAMVLPCLALGTQPAALIARMTRSSMLEVLGTEFIKTARAKGLGPLRVHYVHALRNALIPVVTILGIQVGTLLGGSVLIESIFYLPGLGRLLLTSISTKDYPVVLGCVLVISVVFVFANLVVDVAYAVLDRRIRYA
jgi:peptide/nickel transport system permease protein